MVAPASAFFALVIVLATLPGCGRQAQGPGAAASAGSITSAAAPASVDLPPTTVLIGQSWIGLWRAGRLALRADQSGWQINAARMASNGVLELAAYPTSTAASTAISAQPTVLRFDARTLSPLGRASDPAAAQWPPLPPPIGTDEPARPSDWRSASASGELVAATSAATVLVAASAANGGVQLQPRSAGRPANSGAPSRALPSGEWRAALSPDGSTAVAFVRAAATTAGQAWPAVVWDVASGRDIAAPGFAVDDGQSRENGAARALACLLPHGEGAIVTYIGAPADRYSEYLAFAAGAAAPSRIEAPYVMTCLSADAATPAR